VEKRPLIIVGSGPGGAATALRLSQLQPELARDALVLEKAEHPRDKTCAGGLIPHSVQCLRELGVELSVPHVVVRNAFVRTPRVDVDYAGAELCRVIRRREFDASLVAAVRARGIAVRENEKVVDVARDGDRVRVETESASYQARVVVGADGSGSVVRRRLLGGAKGHTGRAVMCDVPVDATNWRGFEQGRYDFGFLPVAAGIRGYTWAFPCWIDGEPHVNLGAYTVDTEGAALTRWVKHELARLDVDATPRLQAFPIHWYHERQPLAGPGVALVGDAAGVDPLMGEGISFALEYGRRAADAAAAAFASGDFSLAAYERDVRASWVGKKLRRLNLMVRLFYGPAWPLCFAVAGHSRRARELGLRWYNGVDGWDRRSGWDALRAVWSGNFDVAAVAGSDSGGR
jgi:flavin-dependent dehydrogenase